MGAAVNVDLLDDLLAAVSLRARIVFRGVACERWALGGGGTQGRLGFHFVISGSCWARMADAKAPVELTTGALLMYRPECGHLLSHSSRQTAPLAPARLQPLQAGAEGIHVGLLCGFYDGGPACAPLLDALPAYLLWPGLAAMPPPLARLTQAIGSCAFDQTRGGEQILVRLCEVLLLMIMREPSVIHRERVATIRAQHDPLLRRAFQAIHAQPGKRWTLAALARSAGLSRSTFAERFKGAAQMPAMTYLRGYRMALAEKRMDDDGLTVEQAARAMGYRSTASFRRARRRVARASSDPGPGQ
ncbi:MAG: AraC family transcriptional regulator [Pseudomonadota bacterium]